MNASRTSTRRAWFRLIWCTTITLDTARKMARISSDLYWRIKRMMRTVCLTDAQPGGFIHPDEAGMARALIGWFAREARDLPWRHTRDPYAIWVSEVMLQQTTVKAVQPYWVRWMRRWPTVRALAKAQPGQVLKLWEGLGYYRRARHLQRAAQIIRAEWRGRFPRAFPEVLALPGVGRYTAGAICSLAYNQPQPILDGNVMRVLARVVGLRQDPRKRPAHERLWRLAWALVEVPHALPARKLPHATAGNCSALNQALMELGAVVCSPRHPRCGACPLGRDCVARQKGWQERLPNLKKRVKTQERFSVAFVARRGGHILARQRPDGGVNGSLWEFPSVEIEPGRFGLGSDLGQKALAVLRRMALSKLGLALVSLAPLAVVRHSITRFRWRVLAVQGELAPSKRSRSVTGRWLTLAQLDQLPFTAGHRHVLRRLAGKSATSAFDPDPA
jgi:A/G-specific adenine glycosylase